MPTRTIHHSLRAAIAGACAFALAGCISFEAELPTSLLTLTPSASAPAGAGGSAGAKAGKGAIHVLIPETPAKIDVVRVPVTVSATEIAYLQDAVWVEKPARLFRRVLGEAVRAKTDALVVASDDTPAKVAQVLRGSLVEMGYVAGNSSVVVRYDAILVDGDGNAVSRRFEASESGVLPEAGSVGPALNRAANTVADEVADWVAAQGQSGIAPSGPPIMEKASS